MYSISRKYGLTLEALKILNDKTENKVAIGERIRVSDKDWQTIFIIIDELLYII